MSSFPGAPESPCVRNSLPPLLPLIQCSLENLLARQLRIASLRLSHPRGRNAGAVSERWAGCRVLLAEIGRKQDAAGRALSFFRFALAPPEVDGSPSSLRSVPNTCCENSRDREDSFPRKSSSRARTYPVSSLTHFRTSIIIRDTSSVRGPRLHIVTPSRIVRFIRGRLCVADSRTNFARP